MIPKVIHYCWFGGKPLPELAQKCIASWRKYLPDYEIKEWNESNFDVHIIPYTKEAYAASKFAFVSDYARFWILYNYGGVYFDTDVEIIKDLRTILDKGAFMGCEKEIQVNNKSITVAPGLGLAVEEGHPIYKDLLNLYSQLHFSTENMKTIVEYTTELLQEKGLQNINEEQKIEGIMVYPKAYFNPYNFDTGRFEIKPETYSIHHYAASWTTKKNRINRFIYQSLVKIFGIQIIRKIGL